MFIETALAMGALPGPVFPNNLAAANALLSNYRPQQITDYLEEYWRQGMVAWPALDLGLQNGVDATAHLNLARPNNVDVAGVNGPTLPANINLDGWHHLVYAYMLENTRMYDIFRRVVFEYAHGERLAQPSHLTVRWLRTTEELFFSLPRYLSVRTVTSNLRPDDGAVRRNTYSRLLGMDLNHGMEDGRPYPYVRSDAANREFVGLWEALLSEVWKGMTASAPAFSGINETDNNAILTLVRRIRELLTARRLNGQLSREEFDAVACLSWFHLVVNANTQVVVDLSCSATGEADRLKLIGQRVGVAAHSRSDAYFQLAQPMSVVLRQIENGNVQLATAPSLYDNAWGPVNWVVEMQAIITNWSIATGRNMKDGLRRSTLPVLIDVARSTSENGNGAPAPASRIPAALLR